MLEARSVAVVGASVKEGSLGRSMLEELERGGYEGEIFPVNPGYDEVLGHRCFPSIGEVPGDGVDLAILGVANAAHRAGGSRRGRGGRPVDRDVLLAVRGPSRPSPACRRSPSGWRRSCATPAMADVRRQRHGVLPRDHAVARDRVPDARSPAARTGHVHLPLGLGVRGARVQRPRHRVQPARVERPGDRLDDGRLHALRARARGDPRARAAARDRARPGGLPGRARARGRARRARDRAEGRAHRGVEGDGDGALGRARGRARRVRGAVRRVRRARGAHARGDGRRDGAVLVAAPGRRRARHRERARLRRRARAVRRPRARPRRAVRGDLARDRRARSTTRSTPGSRPRTRSTRGAPASTPTASSASRSWRCTTTPTPPRWRSWSTSRARASPTTRATCRSRRTSGTRRRSRSACCRTWRAPSRSRKPRTCATSASRCSRARRRG